MFWSCLEVEIGKHISTGRFHKIIAITVTCIKFGVWSWTYILVLFGILTSPERKKKQENCVLVRQRELDRLHKKKEAPAKKKGAPFG